MRIEVTRRDIMRGRRNSALSCPVAVAIGRAPGVRCVEVAPCTTHDDTTQPLWACFKDKERRLREVLLPEHVNQWVRQFDERGVGNPFEFDLEISDD